MSGPAHTSLHRMLWLTEATLSLCSGVTWLWVGGQPGQAPVEQQRGWNSPLALQDAQGLVRETSGSRSGHLQPAQPPNLESTRGVRVPAW